MSDTHARTVHASSVFERLFERGGGEGGSRGVGEIDPADPMLFARMGLFIDPAGAFLGARPARIPTRPSNDKLGVSKKGLSPDWICL